MIEIKVPRPGESISEVVLSKWFFPDGAFVQKDQEIGEIESDKATLPLISPVNGILHIKVTEGSTIKVGDIACLIEVSEKVPVENKPQKKKEEVTTSSVKQSEPQVENFDKKLAEVTSEPIKAEDIVTFTIEDQVDTPKIKVSPLAQKFMEQHQLSLDEVINGLRRIKKEDVEKVIGWKEKIKDKKNEEIEEINYRKIERKPISQLRKKLSQRLVSVKNETAMLTTFNEVDMSRVIELRNNFQKTFLEKHGIKLGFMSFFAMAAAIALKKFPQVNSQFDGEDWIFFDYVDLGIAVQTDKGLMVPVIRNVEKMGLAEIEKAISDLASKARNHRLGISEMEGGTFTITNGGVFGSLLSTPIINPPQAAILGMHNIVDRPVAVNGKVEIRPMMYIALSYDHRIIDGKDSVSFLVKIKELIENPVLMLLDGDNPVNRLLDI